MLFDAPNPVPPSNFITSVFMAWILMKPAMKVEFVTGYRPVSDVVMHSNEKTGP